MDGVPTIRICGNCQHEFPKINAAVKTAHSSGKYTFSHGMCIRHFIEAMSEMFPIEKIKGMLAQQTETNPSDLSKNTELANMYAQGDFSKGEVRTENRTPLMERFRKLANIKT